VTFKDEWRGLGPMDAGSGPQPAGSVAEQVRRWIDARPVVRDALAMDIVNLSALTRRIMEDTGIEKREAVLAACRRYEFDPFPEYQQGIREVLSSSKLEVRTNVVVITARRSWSFLAKLEEAMEMVRGREVPLHVIQGSEAVTIVTDEGFRAELTDLVGEEQVVDVRDGLVEVNVRSPDVVEDVPGVLAFLTSTLAERGVNFVDVISCYKDNMFLVEEGDLDEVFGTLNRLVGS